MMAVALSRVTKISTAFLLPVRGAEASGVARRGSRGINEKAGEGWSLREVL